MPQVPPISNVYHSVQQCISRLLVSDCSTQVNLAVVSHFPGDALALLLKLLPTATGKQSHNNLPLSNQQHNKRVHISIYSLTRDNLLLSESLQQLDVTNINGCQRIETSDYKLTIDVHQLLEPQPELTSYLKLQANTEQAFDLVIACADTLLNDNWDHYFNPANFWQLGRLSRDEAQVALLGTNELGNNELEKEKFGSNELSNSDITTQVAHLASICRSTGFLLVNTLTDDTQTTSASRLNRQFELEQRQVLRSQQSNQFAYNPLPKAITYSANTSRAIAIIGGGLASAFLALSLAKRGISSTIYCKDEAIAQGASGNKQGAIYPLLTPDNGPLSQFFQQAYLYSCQQIKHLVSNGHNISHEFCGVIHTGYDDKSISRLQKIIDGQAWPEQIAQAVSAEKASEIAGVKLDKSGFYYPLGGWVCPYELAEAAIKEAQKHAEVDLVLNTEISTIEKPNTATESWLLTSASTSESYLHDHLVIAAGAQLTQFSQSSEVALTPFRGQVSHVASKGELSKLSSVICANGYLTPANDGKHCVGASYIKNPENSEFSITEQLQNQEKMRLSYPSCNWTKDIDTSDNQARVGVRMVSRDHFPVMGCAADFEEIKSRYQAQMQLKQWQQTPEYWRDTPAPIINGLYLLGGFGSRGISTAPLVAETLAANLTGETAPLNLTTQTLLNPNRMWMRKLLKGKAI
ncbi:FAD-dependent 5-carboxymethylaminomethyl-2-thiouridine(34) oxidoreductase MnmC [Shewanella sp. WXL01]|uniref:FAD-dependent 5-carboxymethylaminomethyl-2-thiouridine(34) oxidoreductase MnmC n=1 Tax=Shewanella sp. WXL01 TaxID=2709721 RepID=UPI00143856DC|nr:FAD-dependent 5-carboxymethylaminomethyl-2-thiouridine(34) oxidoreductase MnmC [Shewanella sp. WXL01]NKF50256.1 FAD-dependent 5-carboxymethylaminomethyl-2-thiouridine(34) oxidoreductase MnmC [Shewanella sp. WXL01]